MASKSCVACGQTKPASEFKDLMCTGCAGDSKEAGGPKPNFVVIGNGMVGHSLVESLVASGATKKWQIVVFCEEPRLAYNRMLLSAYFNGTTPEELNLYEPGWYEQYGIRTLIGQKAEKVDTEKQEVTATTGEVIPYDKCVFATGSYPFVPPIPGKDGPGIFVYRTIDDLIAIESFAKGVAKKGVVVGGGLLGLEAAQALVNMGLETHVVEFAPRLMCMQLDETGGEVLQEHVEKLGVHIHTKKSTTNIESDGSKPTKLSFADGTELETDMLVFSAGIRPRDQLAKESGITLGPRGGIEVDNYMKTSAPNVYAVGECALWSGRIFGLVSPGNQMARCLVDHLMGKEDNPFLGADMSTKLKIVGTDVAVVGDSLGKEPGCIKYMYYDGDKGAYKKLLVSKDKKRVVGAIFVQNTDEYASVQSIMVNDLPLPEDPSALITPSSNGPLDLGGVDALPDTAKICSCHNVSKGNICEAVKDGCHNLEDLKKCTKAGTGCGGCLPSVTELLKSEKAKMGIETKNVICEHFQLSRQELTHIVIVKQLKDFDEVLKEAGTGGFGCEICKPTVASMLASFLNKPTLAMPALQDTNDYFMGNMQRNGTYSVVPRVPGGEIEPESLIKMGQIAAQYKLYTKVTGGQRIDMFGAQVHQLPEIWDALGAAGFESGHAYAKSLRTVKTCVGSTWCRYGVQDSVGMGVIMENRYKGFRAPHKVKMGVSGCMRECAEAQCKDFGVIATKGGYNLYVCGNGGTKPRHADLFATDLTGDELLVYIDRIMMFYCMTADRLQRTARWLENLEGGLDYLKKVIIEDSLGICADLEAKAQLIIKTYFNEWDLTETQRLRFKTFINQPADKQDNPLLAYEIIRNQKNLPGTLAGGINPYPLTDPKNPPLQPGTLEWQDVCPLDVILPDTGVCALVDGIQIAVFKIRDGRLFAIGNWDAFSEQNVLSRGIVGDKEGVLKVASPLYKQNFALETGICLSNPEVKVPTYNVQVEGTMVQVQSRAKEIQA